MRVLGFMTGTSLDAVDMAVLETDGESIGAFGPAGEAKLSDPLRDLLLEATHAALAWPRGAPEPQVFARAGLAVAQAHLAAAEAFLAANGLAWRDFDLIGMHGQTVLHERPTDGHVGRTVQLGDGAWLAAQAGVPVAFDFRSADVAGGGEGAPLAPAYHLARVQASGLAAPVAVLNLGGVANVTFCRADGSFAAFDTGPANGMIDLLVQDRGAGRFDDGGRYASVGRVDETILAALLAHPYFRGAGAEVAGSLHLRPRPARRPAPGRRRRHADGLHRRDGAPGVRLMGETPREVIACGGGRLNPEIMKALRVRLPVPVATAEDHGWRGDSVEAEAIAYLAARTVLGLPISFPATTGVKASMTGGRIAYP